MKFTWGPLMVYLRRTELGMSGFNLAKRIIKLQNSPKPTWSKSKISRIETNKHRDLTKTELKFLLEGLEIFRSSDRQYWIDHFYEERYFTDLPNLSMTTSELERSFYIVQQAEMSRSDSELYKFLKEKYKQHELLEKGDQIYPVVCYAAPDSQQTDIKSVLTELDRRIPDKKDLITDKRNEYITLMRQLERPITNRTTYTMVDLEIGNDEKTLGLRCELGKYEMYLETCRALEWEILSRWEKSRPKSEADYAQFDESLVLRKRLHNEVANPLIDGRKRSVCLAVSTLIAYVHDNNLLLWVKQRSTENVAIDAGLLHVIPSGMFQPVTRRYENEFWDKGGDEGSVANNIYREYLEEAFKEPEREDAQHWRYFYDHICLEKLRDYIRDGQSELYFTGICVNLLTVSAELCTLLVIKTPEWWWLHTEGPYEYQFKINVEWKYDASADEISRGLDVDSLEYSDIDEKMIEDGQLYAYNMSPVGAAAFWLGIDVLRKRVLPKLQVDNSKIWIEKMSKS